MGSSRSSVSLPQALDEPLDFTITAIDGYHLVAAGESYWQNFESRNRLATDRFLLKPGWRTVYANRLETALVKVTFADGSTGWGEATEPICPEIVCRLAVDLLAPVLGSRHWASPAELWKAGYDLNRCRGHGAGYQMLALAAVDVAIWDALACRAKKPVAMLLGLDPAISLETYISGLRLGTLGERVELLRRVIGAGAAGAKIFVDADTESTLAELAGLREDVPGNWKLIVDALWSYETANAVADARRRFGEFDVNWFECPIAPEDIDGHRTLYRAGGVPVALGEHFHSHHQSAPWLAARVLDVFQPDLCRTGFSDGLVQAGLARDADVRVTPHMGSGSPVVQVAALQFAAVCRADEPCEYQYDLAACSRTSSRPPGGSRAVV